MRVGYGPAPGPTIKKALCHTCPFGGAGNKYSLSLLVELKAGLEVNIGLG